MLPRTDWARALWVFLCTAAFLLWIAGNRLVLVNDEGIYLDGAVRVLRGSLPYRDFFALTGPGTFWNLALMFQLAGVSLVSARILLVVDMALICACMYWLTARFVSPGAGFWLYACYLALLSPDSGNLVVNHRWDSTALSMAALTCFVQALGGGRFWQFGLAGACAGYAAWVTPPAAIGGVVLLAACLFLRRHREAMWMAAGIGSVSAVGFGVLIGTGSLQPLLAQMRWTALEYSGANRFAYGAVIGGYAQFFTDVHGAEVILRALLVLFLALPAIAPVVGAAWLLRNRSPGAIIVVGFALAAVAACYPRLDIGHLVFAAPTAYVAAICAGASLPYPRMRATLMLAATCGAVLFVTSAISQRTGLSPATLRIGRLAGQPQDLTLVAELERFADPGDRFFAFPYLPFAYFVTRAHNPTTYSFMQPGMMGDADENLALSQLNASPPSKVLYMDVPPESYLRLFPSSDPRRLRLSRIEAWLRRNYEPRPMPPESAPGYQFLVRKQESSGLPVGQ